jgi:LuxR family quorum-sensing system transcriptional regulator CciR
MFVSSVRHELVELVVSNRRVEDLAAALDTVARHLGFDFHAIVSLPSGCRRGGATLFHNYPDEWAIEYQRLGLHTIDPVLRASQQWACGFRWADIEKIINPRRHDGEMLRKARQIGIGDGFTIPANVPGTCCGSVTFAVEPSRSFPMMRLIEAEAIGSIAFQTWSCLTAKPVTSKQKRLTDRQLECLYWSARDKTNPEIAIIMGIEPDTVKKHLAAVFRRYQVPTRLGLTVSALIEGLLSLADLRA